MHLREELVLPQAWATKVKVKITQEDPQITITVRTALTPDVALAFGCRDIVYAGNVPRSGIDKINLEGEQIDPEFHLKNDNLAFYAVANSMGKYVAKMEGTGPMLEFEIRLTGFAELVVDLATRVKVDPMELILKPAQLNMELHDEKPAPGDRVISEEQAADTSAEKDAEFGVAAEAPLAPAAVMGGTHQRGRKKRSAAAPAPEPEDESDLMSELGVPDVVQ
jgi:hypothetical protein